MSPTVLRSGPYRLFFFSNEAGEAPHIHVQRERKLAKFWLDPVRIARSTGRIEGIVKENEVTLLEAWHEYFAD